MKTRILAILVYALPTLCMAAVLAFNIFRPIQVIPRMKPGPGFGLTDLQSGLITNETMRGKIVLYNFSYTHCATACAPLMDKMHQVWQRLAEVSRGDIPIEFVTISIDPERDTPAALATYAAPYLPTTPNSAPWHFLRETNLDKLKITVSQGFNFPYKKVPATNAANNDYQFNFVPMIVLIDGWGVVRAEYRQFETDRLRFSENTSDIDPNIIIRDLNLVTAEARNSTGLTKSVYEAAHLFACYPP